jgi:cell division protein FtsQ
MKKETRVERKRKRRRLLFKSFLAVAIIAALTFYSLTSDFFSLEEVITSGNEKVSRETLISEAGISSGDNILRLRKAKLIEGIERIPYIKEAHIKKKLPDTIEIQVTERKPYLQFENGYSFAVIDIEGVLLENSILRVPEVGLVKGIKWDFLKDGESIQEKEAGLFLADVLNDSELASIVGKIKDLILEEDGNIKFILFNGITVEFGPMNNVKYKLKVLEEILADVEKKNIPTKMIIMNKGEHPILVRDDV